MIIIQQPYKIEENGYQKLCSDIIVDGVRKKVWYEVENKYGNFLDEKSCDAFLVAALPWALTLGKDIYVKGTVSYKLFFQLKEVLLPTVLRKISEYKKINLICNGIYSQNNKNMRGGVGLGISCGVDSLYSYYSKKESAIYESITHLTYFNVGSHRDEFHGVQAQELFCKRLKNAKQFATEEKKQFVAVNSNVGDIFAMQHFLSHVYRSVSAVLALQNLFSIYYYSAGYTYEEFKFDNAPAKWQIYLLPLLSNERVSFYSVGEEADRIAKLQYICQYKGVIRHLDICQHEYPNCGMCEKCRRTACELWAIGKLEEFGEVINIEKIKENFAEYQLYWLDKADIDIDYYNAIRFAKNRGIKISVWVNLHHKYRKIKRLIKRR